MIGLLLGSLALGGLSVLAYRLRKTFSAQNESLRHPKGWITPAARIEEALEVADRHLATARAGANVRLQYGQAGCLTMIRSKPRGGSAGFVARWEFWRPDEALAHRLLNLPAARIDRTGRAVLELAFPDDYLRFRQAMLDAFGNRGIEVGNMHLTWNC